MNFEGTLDSLRGEELNAVCFVMDYVEFHFNGPILRALSDPKVKLSDASWRFPEAGSREALCGLIGLTVEEVFVIAGREMELRFAADKSLFIPLQPKVGSPEAAHFVPNLSGPIQVW